MIFLSGDNQRQGYKTYFTKNKPSRSAFGADGLALGAKLELECWAVEKLASQ